MNLKNIHVNLLTTLICLFVVNLCQAQTKPNTNDTNNKKFDYDNTHSIFNSNTLIEDEGENEMEIEINTPKNEPVKNNNVTSAKKPSLLNRLELINTTEKYNPNFTPRDIPKYADDVYAHRFTKIITEIPLEYNELVKQYIDLLVIEKRAQTRSILPKTTLFFPVINKILSKKGLPDELSCLTIVLSALMPQAKSLNGGYGLWQLSYDVANRYGLAINSFIDERADLVLSTEVATDYLNTLHNKYQDWHLAIAAFASSEKILDNALRQAQSRYYWNVAQYLPEETQMYVPMFIASVYLLNYHNDHNLHNSLSADNYPITDTLIINKAIGLNEISTKLNISNDELNFYNPIYKQNYIPFSDKGRKLVLSANKVEDLKIMLGNKFVRSVSNKAVAYHQNTSNTTTTIYNAAYEAPSIRPNTQKIQQYKLIEDIANYKFTFKPGDIPTYDDLVIKNRLFQINTTIPLEYNDYVKAFIEMYTIEKREQVKRMLPKMDIYESIFTKTLDKKGLPIELKYLPIVLSALMPQAKSNSGNEAGLWQIPYGIAKNYNLTVNFDMDERYDPLLSTNVAAEYIKTLYNKYQDWYLTIAAYTAGETVVNKAINESRSTNYWQIAQKLPEIAQTTVPLFIAAVYVMNHYPAHNFASQNAPYTYLNTDTVMINRLELNIKNTCDFIGIETEDFLFLNPAYKQSKIPYSITGNCITLPVAKIEPFLIYINNLKSAAVGYTLAPQNKKINAYLPIDSPLNYTLSDYTYKSNTENTKVENSIIQLNYEVQENETLQTISNQFNCTSTQLMSWNKMPNLILAPKQKLIIEVPMKDKNYYDNMIARKKYTLN